MVEVIKRLLKLTGVPNSLLENERNNTMETQDNSRRQVKNMGFVTRWPDSGSWLCPFLAVCLEQAVKPQFQHL